MEEKKLTGYPSIDKPWLKYYSEEAIHTTIPQKTMYDLIFDSNKCRLDHTAIRYYGNNISYRELFKNTGTVANAFSAHGIVAGDVVTILSLNTPETTYTPLNAIISESSIAHPAVFFSPQILKSVDKMTNKKFVF